MRSKYLDPKKLKECEQIQQILKKSRKQTKPKRSHKIYGGQQNETQSDSHTQNKNKYKKQSKPPIDKKSKQYKKKLQKSSKYCFPFTQQSNSQKNIQDFQRSNPQKQKRKNHETNFISQINSYLNQLKRSKLTLTSPKQQNYKNQTMPLKSMTNFQQTDFEKTIQNPDSWEKKIKKQKSINRNLQKCIIEIQKILWQRNDKLQALEDEIRRQSRHKQKYPKKTNELDKKNLSKTIFFSKDFDSHTQYLHKPEHKNIFFKQTQKEKVDPLKDYSKISFRHQFPPHEAYETYSQTQRQSQTAFKQKQKRPRRKTQTPLTIQKILSKTVLAKEFEKAKKQKSYNKFQKQVVGNNIM